MADQENQMESTEMKNQDTCRRIPVQEIIEKLDRMLEQDEPERAMEHLKYWLSEAEKIGDWGVQLTVANELAYKEYRGGAGRTFGSREGNRAD